MKKLNKLSPLILIAISIFFMMWFYHAVLLHPNDYLFNSKGDAIKNYFTYASQVREHSFINSRAMNYPYGENFLYLDCQPVIGIMVRLLSGPFPELQESSVGVINFLMVFSFLITSILLFLILSELGVNRFISAIGAFSIAVLAPQIFRVTGHLALSYSFFIPLGWYLYIRYSGSRQKWKWSLIMFAHNLFWYFVHAYLGMILVTFVFFCFVFDLILRGNKEEKILNRAFHASMQVLLPLILFWSFALVTDHHVGRTNNPYGFLIYTSNLSSVFLPNHPPLKPLLDKFIRTEQIWEGWAYIGIGTSICILLFSFNMMTKRFLKKSFIDDEAFPARKHLIVAIFSSTTLLLLSMGLPFKWKLEFLLDWFPVIKNFRGIGRFAWVFYFVITVSGICYVDLIRQTGKRKPFNLLIALILPLSLVFEGIIYHRDVGRSIVRCPDYFNREQLPESYRNGLNVIETDRYQAIIPLPFYHKGSENFRKPGTDKIYRISMVLSFHSNIPIMGNYSTRTSIPESKKLVQLLTPNFYRKEIRRDIGSDLPFLVIYSKEDLSKYERPILERSVPLYSNDEYSLYSISRESLFQNTAGKEISDFEKIRDKLVSDQGFLTEKADSHSVVIHRSYDSLNSKYTFRGRGAYSGRKGDYNLLEEVKPGTFKNNTDYLLSFWMYNGGGNYGQDVLGTTLFIQAKDTSSGKSEWIASGNPALSVVIDGDWSLAELGFRITDSTKTVSVYAKDYSNSNMPVHIDDLLIREQDVFLYRVDKVENGQISELFKNNHKICCLPESKQW